MLILTRTPGQVVLIDGGRIRVTVVAIRGDVVRLGFEAPDSTAIVREEIAEKWQADRLGPYRGKPELPRWSDPAP